MAVLPSWSGWRPKRWSCRLPESSSGSLTSGRRAAIEKEMRRIAEGTAQAYNVAAEVVYTREFTPLINDAALVDEALAAARTVLAGAAGSDTSR